MPTRGNVRDIRTGKSLGRTDDLNDVLIGQIKALRLCGRKHYVVSGPCRMLDSRIGVDLLRAHGVTVIRDRQFPADTLWLFEGTPDELGFEVA